MTKKQFQRERLRRQAERAQQLQLLAEAEASANQIYVIGATGFWLHRWNGKRHPTRGTKRKRLPIYGMPLNTSAAQFAHSA